MQFDITMEGVDDALASLDLMDRNIERGAVSALNKIGAQGVTVSVRTMTNEYNIKTRDVKKGVRLIRARAGSAQRAGRIYATIAASGGAFPLFKFGGLPKAPVSQAGIPAPYKGRRRASVRVRRGAGRTTLKHAFVARMRSGHVGIFERRGPRSLPVKELYSLGVAQMFKLKAVDALVKLMREKGPRTLRHEIGYQMSRNRMKRRAV